MPCLREINLSIHHTTLCIMRSAGSSSPEAYPFQAFLDRLSAAAEDEPRLGAIALEIEALNSIFESSGRLHDRSRPVSWQSDAPRRSQGGSLNSDTTTSTHGAQEDFTSLSAAIKSLPAQTDSDREPLSASANISHFEELNLGIGPSDRLRYELAIPLLDEADAAWAEIEQRGLNSSNPAPLVRILVGRLQMLCDEQDLTGLRPHRYLCLPTIQTHLRRSCSCWAATLGSELRSC